MGVERMDVATRLIRNMVEASQIADDHILWFYVLNAFDYVNVPNALRAKPGVLEERIDGLLEAHQIILRAILQQQLADIEQGIPPSNRVDPKKLHAPEKAHLMWALKQVPLVRDMLGVPVA